MKAPDAASGPLVAWLVREFEPQAAFGGWEFRMRRGSRPARLYQGQWLDDGRLVVDLPQLGNDLVDRVEVVDVDAGRILIDSTNTSGLVVSDEEGAKAQIDDQGIDVSRPRRLAMSGGVAASASADRPVVVRLWTSDSRPLAIVPVVTAPRTRAIIRD